MATLPTAGAARTGNNLFLRIVAGLSTLCGWIAAAMILSAVLITCQMIFIRFVLGQSTIWQTEAVIYLVLASTLLGLPYVQLMRGHVNVDLMPLWTKGPMRKALAFLVLGSSIVIIGVMALYAYEMWHFAWARGWRSETVWAVRLWIPYLAMPVGFGLYLLQLGADMYALAFGIEKPFGLEDN
ncbi:MAG: TRAP transporter small permease [Roseicyclus sp.]|uniref:TRAP transporter small permease n=1 Tax=Roseicyclus sp. TaxID=1914329 RepID=UPI003A88871A